MSEFTAQTYGKWILAGEHAVLRGCPALVFPIKKFAMTFHWQSTAAPLDVGFDGETGDELKLIFWGLLEHALEKAGRKRADLKGHLQISSSLPLGAGLGASGALCVGVGRLFSQLDWIPERNIYEFSRTLENLFHGESSGVDIAVALEGRGLRFMRGGERSTLDVNWQPNLYLSYSGKRGVTSDCVRRVNELRAENPELGEKIDREMREAVSLCERALADDQAHGFDQLVRGIDMARDAFYQWGLCEGPLDQHIRELQRSGAIAVKPTGSGGGGYVLSLWRAGIKPTNPDLIPLF